MKHTLPQYLRFSQVLTLAEPGQPAPIGLQRALCTIENYVGNYLEHAKLKMAS